MEGTFAQHLCDVSVLIYSVHPGGWDSARGFGISSAAGYVDSTWDCGIFPVEVLACGHVHR